MNIEKKNTLPRTRIVRAIGAIGADAAALVVLAACTAAGAPTSTGSPAASGPSGGGGASPGRAGVSGLIAYAQDELLQVQGDGEQTAVRYTSDTEVRKTATADASAIAVGDCIVSVAGEDAETATTITVTAAASDGTCTGGLGGGRPSDLPSGAPGGGMPSGAPDGGGMPSGAPDGVAPSGGPGGFGRFTVGSVTAVSGSTLTVETTGQDGTSTADVSIGSDTTITATVDADVSDIAVGLCVTALGTADDSGGYDATSLALSDPAADGTCSSGLGGGFPGGARGDQGGSDG